MNDLQGSFLISPVKAHIQMKVAKAGPKPVPLESERKLGIRFGISRPTVHRAMQELVDEGWCLKLPGRRLLYTNPERSNPITRNIGLFSGNLFSNDFHSLSSFSGLFSGLADNRTFVHFCRLYSEDFESRVAEFKNLDLDGAVFYFSGDLTETVQKFIRRIIDDGIPAICLANQFSIRKFPLLPEKQCVYYDVEKVIRDRVRMVSRLQFKKVALLDDNQKGFENFNRLSGGLADPESLITSQEDIPRHLPGIIAQRKPDLIICEGGAQRYRLLFQTLKKISASMVPDLMVYRQAQFVCPDLTAKYHVHFMDEGKSEFARGLKAAELISCLINQKNRNAVIQKKHKK